jgi:hypothetical protein
MECMRSGIVWLVVIGICFLLLVPGVSALDLLQQKNRATMSWQDLQTSANDMKQSSSTLAQKQDVVDTYTTAENKLKAEYDNAKKSYDADYYKNMHLMEADKWYLYKSMKEMEQARAYSAAYDAKGKPISGPQSALDVMQANDNAAKYERAEDQADTNANNLNNKFQTEYSREHHGGCLIVTATFGSPLASEVQLVRDYRDGTIRQSYTGSQFFMGFNAWYYLFSPSVADYIAAHPLVKSVMRVCLVPLLEIILLSQNLHAILGFSPEIATVSVLLFGAASYSLVYIFPPAFLTVWLAKRRGWKVPAPGSIKPVLMVWCFLMCGLTAGIFLSLDLLTIVTSGLLVACTIILIAGTASLMLAGYLADRSCVRQS